MTDCVDLQNLVGDASEDDHYQVAGEGNTATKVDKEEGELGTWDTESHYQTPRMARMSSKYR